MSKESVILIVDDDRAVLRMFARALESSGHRVLTAADADTAIQLARTHLPNVILSDINMPGTDGRSFLRNLRTDADLAATQFVLMTGNTHDMDSRRAMDEGADDFLCKPFDVGELCRCVEARLARARVHWRVEDRMVGELRANLGKTMPHEFFTPLTGVIGMANILGTDWQSLPADEVSEIIREIEQSAWRLHRTLRNYLYVIDPSFPDLKRSVKPEPMPGADLALAMESTAFATARKYGREVDIHLDLVPPELALDLNLLALLLEELVENACSFSASGSPIRIACSAEGRLTVADVGRGMSEGQIQRIKVFRQFERKLYEQQGLGLGLTIVRRIAEAFHAELSIESQTGAGTTVAVQFPGATTREAAPALPGISS